MDLLVFRGSIAHVVDYLGLMLLGAKAVNLEELHFIGLRMIADRRIRGN